MMARPKQVTDEELLDIALNCFLEHGFNVSTQTIADRVGLSQPVLFKRFGTKQELFLRAVVPPEHPPVFDWLNESPSPGPFRPQLIQLLEKVSETLSWILPRVRLLKDARIPRETVMARYKSPPPEQLFISIVGFFERAQQQGQINRSVSPQLMAQLVFGALMGREYLSETIPQKVSSKDTTNFIESTADLLCCGMMEDKD